MDTGATFGGILPLLQLIFVFTVPALLLSLADRIPIIGWLSPAFFCYVAGICMTLIPGFALAESFANPLISATVVLAIPMMLFSTHIQAWMRLAPVMSLSMGLWTLSIALSASLGIYLFKGHLPEIWNLGGMSAGVYIGGTANMAAIQVAQDVESAVFVEMNLTDMILSAILLLVLLTVARRLLGLFLPAYQPLALPETNETEPDAPLLIFTDWKAGIRAVALALGVSLLVLALAAGLSWLIRGKIADGWMIVLITLGGLGASLIPRIRNLPLTYESGEYIFLVFCVAIGSQVDLHTFLQNSHPIMGLMACTLYGGMFLHILLARVFKIDADTVVITITAGTFGPPFIGPIANSLQNREIVASGMTIGVAGLALGNFVGLLLAWMWGP